MPPARRADFPSIPSGWLNGNRINLTYTDTATNTQHQVSIVRVDDPAALPLTNSATADPNDEVFGVDFSGGLASVVTQLNALFGGGLQFANPSGTTLQVLDDGAANTTDVDAFSMTQTATALANGRVALPLFTDGAGPFTGAITAIGIANASALPRRIAVNPALLGDPSKLVLYGAGIATGDPTRPNLIYDRLTSAAFAFSPETGLGNAASPYTGNVPDFCGRCSACRARRRRTPRTWRRARTWWSTRSSSASTTPRASTSTRKWPI